MVEEFHKQYKSAEKTCLKQSEVNEERKLPSRKGRFTLGIIAIVMLCIIAGISTDIIYSNAFENQPQIIETLVDIITSVAIFSLTFWGILRLRRHLNAGNSKSA